MLAAQQLAVSSETEQHIRSMTERPVLPRWLERTVSVESVERLFEEP